MGNMQTNSVSTEDDMITNEGTDAPRGRLARLTGGAYLLYFVTMVLSDVLAHTGPSGAQALAGALMGGGLAFRAGIALFLVSALLFALVAWGLHALLRPVNRELALLFLLLNAIGVAIHCVSMFPLLQPMLHGGADPAAYALAAAGAYKLAFASSQLFFGAWLFPLGIAVYRSAILPRFLGVLLLADGVAVLVWFFQEWLLPDFPALRTPGLLVSFAAELGLALWLLLKGVKRI
jgi:hypothetical protein